jgi:hypothetical protein
MSQENVDRFLEGIEAFSRNDIASVLRLMLKPLRPPKRIAGIFISIGARPHSS